MSHAPKRSYVGLIPGPATYLLRGQNIFCFGVETCSILNPLSWITASIFSYGFWNSNVALCWHCLVYLGSGGNSVVSSWQIVYCVTSKNPQCPKGPRTPGMVAVVGVFILNSTAQVWGNARWEEHINDFLSLRGPCQQERMWWLQKGPQLYVMRVNSQENLCLSCPTRTTLWGIL